MNVAFEIRYLVFIFGTLVFSFLINLLFLKFVKSLGMRNTSETAIRWNANSRPSIGGLSFYIVFLLSISFISIAFDIHESRIHKREIGILAASSLGFLMGLADDAYNTKPMLKSITQIVCGLILVFTGTIIQVFDIQIFNILLTIVWVMGIMNSINMLDNMDGISGSVSLTILLTIIGSIVITGFTANFYLILISGMASSLIAFLFFNWYPSKMFMGDSGSQFLGIFLASMGIIFFWNLEPIDPTGNVAKKILLPILAFIVPIADTTTVVINRISNGTSPFVGGKDHTTHNLARIGFKDRHVAIIISIISVLSGIIILYSYNDKHYSTGEIVSIIFYLIFIFISLFSVTKMKREKSA